MPLRQILRMRDNPVFHQALNKHLHKSFSVAALTTTYMNEAGCLHQSIKAARQYVYRNMQRMIAEGLMRRISSGKRWPVYQLVTELVPPTPISNVVVFPPSCSLGSGSYQKLQERLRHYQEEMLTALGEAEEYSTISAELPDIRDEAQRRCNKVRDECSRLLGKVKAIESLLAQHQA
jgi:hypothetical protein